MTSTLSRPGKRERSVLSVSLLSNLMAAVMAMSCGDSQGGDVGGGGNGGSFNAASTSANKTSGSGPTATSSKGAVSAVTTSVVATSSATVAAATVAGTTVATVATTAASSTTSSGLPPDVDGSPCTMDAECMGGVCLNEAQFGYPGGQCSENCFTRSCTDPNSICSVIAWPVGHYCFPKCDPDVAGSCGDQATLECVGPVPGMCWSTCNDDTDCTVSGYRCDPYYGSCKAPEICDNLLDDNGDGWLDCSDVFCYADPACAEDCTNGSDDNGEGLIDCQDPRCYRHPVCIPPPTWTCLEIYYNEAIASCDCDCGAVDPDCALPNPTIHNCGPQGNGASCSSEGECIPPAP